MDFSEVAKTIKNAVRDYPNRYAENTKRIAELEGEQNDLLHLIEFTKFNAVDGYKIAKRLQEIRQERRTLKDENEQLKHLQPIFTKWRDRLGQLDKAVNSIEKYKTSIDSRGYRCRVRKDLEDKINGVK